MKGHKCLTLISLMVVGVAVIVFFHGEIAPINRSRSEGRFLAYSLQAAERWVRSDPNARNNAELISMGGITRLCGMVYDVKNKDLILVGQINPGEEPITIDHFATAMRAILLEGQYPLVSIDRTSETAKTGKQVVRFEPSSIANTQYGQDMVNPDIILKKIALGELLADIESYFSMSLAEFKKRKTIETHIGSQFWYHAVKPFLVMREDVFAIQELAIGVRTKVLYAIVNGKPHENLTAIRDEIGDRFASQIEQNFQKLSVAYPSIARLKPLFDLAALAKGIQELPSKPDLNYWLYEYKVEPVETPTHYDLISRRSEVQGAGGQFFALELEGGIEINPLVVRLQAGDVTALREAVLNSRPSRKVLTWRVPLEGWQIPGAPPSSIETSPTLRKGNGFELSKRVKSIQPLQHLPSGVVSPQVKVDQQFNLPQLKLSDSLLQSLKVDTHFQPQLKAFPPGKLLSSGSLSPQWNAPLQPVPKGNIPLPLSIDKQFKLPQSEGLSQQWKVPLQKLPSEQAPLNFSVDKQFKPSQPNIPDSQLYRKPSLKVDPYLQRLMDFPPGTGLPSRPLPPQWNTPGQQYRQPPNVRHYTPRMNTPGTN